MINRYGFAEMEETNIFIVRNGERSREAWRAGGFIAIGWSKARDLDKETDWYAFKEVIRQAYAADWGPVTPQSLALQASSAFQFIRKIVIGDLILVPVPGAFLAAKVLSPAYYDHDATDDDAWKHRVEWLTTDPCPRGYCANALQRRLKVRQTCVNVTDLRTEIIDALNRTHPVSFSEVVLAKAYEPVASALLNAIIDQQLEDLVAQLAQTSGAKAVRAAKNTKAPGDADEVATYELGIGNEESTIKVAYQVKQHDGATGITGVMQLIERMEADSEIVRGCIVTTAEQLDEAAQKLADENDIVVITKKGLVEWILMSGLKLLRPA